MIRYLIGLLAVVAAPIAAQTVTVTAPLPDKSGDGRVTVNTMAAQLGVAKGTVLTRCGTTLVYVGPKTPCPGPVAQAASVVAPPVVTTAPRDFGANGQIGYGGNTNVHAIRTMDAFPLRTTSSGKSLTDIRVDQARMFVTPEKAASLTINDVTINRVDAKVTKRGIYVRGNSARWDIGNFRLTYVGSTDTGDYPMGIQIAGNAVETSHDIVIHDGYIAAFKNTLPKGYPNADGIDCERGTYNITVRRVTIEDVTDGAIDCKATNLRLEDVTAKDVGHRSFRIWGTATAGTITSINPGWSHIWAAKTANLSVAMLVAVGSAPLVDSEAGAVVTIAGCDLTAWTGKVPTKGGGKVALGLTCRR